MQAYVKLVLCWSPLVRGSGCHHLLITHCHPPAAVVIHSSPHGELTEPTRPHENPCQRAMRAGHPRFTSSASQLWNLMMPARKCAKRKREPTNGTTHVAISPYLAANPCHPRFLQM
ncbi:hypothetical protein BDZ97DRAFT_559931 [Flammula alnicola]|nr:hypothetical protein BDZ97DRAFT_559931 [Flammula alnicola]